MAPFDVAELRRRGFEGFVTVSELHGPQPAELPAASGVYVVVRTATGPPAFLERSGAGWWKRKDPTVPLERLRREWVEDAQTLYIGKAACLRQRVGLLLDFGRGGDVMHYGGRLLWQMVGIEDVVMAWRKATRFAALETEMIDEFVDHFGRLPYANLRRGDRVVR
jgi:hypothetical protein